MPILPLLVALAVVVPRSWDGRTAVILATGPSLTVDDVEYVKGKAQVIAVNDAYRLCPWADVLYASDVPWWATHHEAVRSFQGMKFTVAQNRTPKPIKGLPDVQVLSNTGSVGLELDPSGVRTGLNSGYAAINLAVHFGVSMILLLGYNMAPVHKRRHFFGNHKGLPNSSDYTRFVAKYRTLVEPLRARGVDVINCTSPTRLDCWPCRPLREVLA